MDDLNDPAASPAEATPKVTGIGGVFFFADNPQELRDWYANNLGFEINAWGAASFDSRDLKHAAVEPVPERGCVFRAVQKGIYA